MPSSQRGRARLVAARAEVATCAISGAVGTFANIDPAVEAYVAEKLGLVPEPVSTQVIPRDRHAMFFATLGVIASSIERLAVEIRHLQRTEVLEAEEYFAPGPEGVERDAAQAEPGADREPDRAGAAGADGGGAGDGGRGALARARHQPLVGRADDRARRDGDARLRAGAADERRRPAGGLSGEHAAEHEPVPWPDPFAAGAAGADPGRGQPRGRLCVGAAQRDEGLGSRARTSWPS